MDDWEKFDVTTLTEKEKFYSNLNMEDIADANEKIFKKILIKYYDVCLQSDALYLADVSENFMKMCLKIYYLDSVKLLSAYMVGQCRKSFQ